MASARIGQKATRETLEKRKPVGTPTTRTSRVDLRLRRSTAPLFLRFPCPRDVRRHRTRHRAHAVGVQLLAKWFRKQRRARWGARCTAPVLASVSGAHLILPTREKREVPRVSVPSPESSRAIAAKRTSNGSTPRRTTGALARRAMPRGESPVESQSLHGKKENRTRKWRDR